MQHYDLFFDYDAGVDVVGGGGVVRNVPLDEMYSFDYEIGSGTTDKTTENTTDKTIYKLPINLTLTEKRILEEVRVNPGITQTQLAMNIGITTDGVRYAIKNLKSKDILSRIGSRRNGTWTILSK
ncbi:MarR family transcriptional regulator [Enterocloster lavalensis]|uniref:MarR family transcriptional regulator n=2 Tax=Enterocloster lavalensis TaxID=460384 RepID=UPI0034A5410C